MDKLGRVLKALADPKRLKILRLLKDSPYCVRALSCKLGISESAVSQHLKLLRENSLVTGRKRGYWTHYQVQSETIRRLLSGLEEALITGPSANGPCPEKESSDPCCRKGGEPHVRK